MALDSHPVGIKSPQEKNWSLNVKAAGGSRVRAVEEKESEPALLANWSPVSVPVCLGFFLYLRSRLESFYIKSSFSCNYFFPPLVCASSSAHPEVSRSVCFCSALASDAWNRIEVCICLSVREALMCCASW